MELASAAEAAGFFAMHATEHPFPSRVGANLGGHHSLDPMLSMAFAAAATTNLRLHFYAFIPTYRNPFLGAKSLSDLDVLSGGRVIAGLAPGYMVGEFDALGVPFNERGERFDEALVAMKAAWTGDPVYLQSVHWVARGNTMRPRSEQRPHPPIWIGGNSNAAIRRAVLHGQGWMPFPALPDEAKAVHTWPITSADDLRVRIERLTREATAHGRTEPMDVCTAPFTHKHHPRGQEQYNPSVLLGEVKQLRDIGVTCLSIKLPSPNRATLLDYIERFGNDIIGA
jgi:probable F420-dependent oxidoreductase